MLRKSIELDLVEQKRYEEVKNQLRKRKQRDIALIFDKVVADFLNKYGLGKKFFEENFFQDIANNYSDVCKRAVDYYNNTNKEISIARQKMLKEYGYNDDKEYKEAVSFDGTKEILGFPSYLNPDKSLVVIKSKFAEPFIKYLNELYQTKILELLKHEIKRVKNGGGSSKTANGEYTVVSLFNDYQTLIFLFLDMRLKCTNVISYDRLAYGKITYATILEATKELVEERDEELLAYTGKQEIVDRWAKGGKKASTSDYKRVYGELNNEYILNKDAVIDYSNNMNYDLAMLRMTKYEENKYYERISMIQVLQDAYNNAKSAGKVFKFGDRIKANKLIDLVVSRYPEIGEAQILKDIEEKSFRSQAAINYDDACKDIEDGMVNINVMLNYTYEMNPKDYNEQMAEKLAEIERVERENIKATDADYDEYENRLISENLGPQFVEGYVDKIDEIKYKTWNMIDNQNNQNNQNNENNGNK